MIAMKYLFLILLLPLYLHADLKEEIASLEKTLKTEKDKGAVYLKLALAHFKDQEQDKAFENFLLSLDHAPKKRVEITDEEKKLYEEALELYLDPGDPHETATLLLNRFEKELALHPSYSHLHLLISSAYGNKGDFERFFKYFYENYDPSHFLAYKTKGILLLRLASHENSLELREKKKKEALQLLEKALESNSLDPSLYRLLYVSAKERDEKREMIGYLEKLAKNRVKIARGDIFFYVKECVDLEQRDLAESVLQLAKETYHYSRAISQAEDYLTNRLK
jgi:tetratricopeptide (TPR) repeat protein